MVPFIARLTLPFTLTILLGGELSAQLPEIPVRNMGVLGHSEPITVEEAGGTHNSCWGYAAPDGHEYGFLGTRVGTYVIDLDADPIEEVAFIPGPFSVWRNIKTFGEVAYISTENRAVEEGAGLQIVDLSSLPDSASLIRTDTSLMLSAHTLWMADGFLYALGTRADVGLNGGALIMDVATDPRNPVRVGGVGERYYHDAFVRNDTLVGAAINDGGADIVDVTDKENPVILGRISYPFAGTHNTAITSDGAYVLTSDEIGFTPKTMKVWDIADLDDPIMVAAYSPNLVETIHNIRVRGRYAFVAWYTAGVRVIDMADPLHPREVASADTYGGPDGGFNGVWEVYPFLPSGRILASDRNSGLYLLGFNGATAGSIAGNLLSGADQSPVEEYQIEVSPNGNAEEPGSDGSYYVGGVVGESVSMTISAYGFHDTTLTRELTGDITLDVELRPRAYGQLQVEVRDRVSGEPITGFSWAVDGVVLSTTSTGPAISLDLPREVDYTLIVGKWGHLPERRAVRLERNETEVTLLLDRGYADDATLDLGWGAGSEDNATTGVWERIEPYLGYPRSDWIHPEREPSGLLGWIFFTGRPPLFAPPDRNDISGGASSIVSPPMDLSGYNDPMILLDRWYVHFEKDTVLDALTVDLSPDNGATWREAYHEIKGKSGWRRVLLFARDHLPLTTEVRVRIRASDTLGNILVVAGMDNFEVVDRAVSGVEGGVLGVEGDLSIVPNPARRHTRVVGASSAPKVLIEIFDLLGQLALTQEADVQDGRFDATVPIDRLPSGSYRIVVNTRAEVISQSLIVK